MRFPRDGPGDTGRRRFCAITSTVLKQSYDGGREGSKAPLILFRDLATAAVDRLEHADNRPIVRWLFWHRDDGPRAPFKRALVRAVETERRILVEHVEIRLRDPATERCCRFEDVLDDATASFRKTPDDDISLIRPAPMQLSR